MSRLTFTAESLIPIIQHAVDAKEHSPIFAQMCEEKHLKKGEKMPTKGYANSDQIDHSKIGAGITFVKDEGIYMMSNAKERDLITVNGRERSRVSYAIGFDPNENGDVWHASADAVGGNDFSEAL